MTATAPGTSATPVNLLSPEFRENPYPGYAMLREHGLGRITPFDSWAAARYDDVLWVLKQPKLFSSTAFRMTRPDMMLAQAASSVPAETVNQVMLRDVPSVINSDPPEHERYRGILNRGFTPRRIDRLEPRIREIARECVDAVVGKGRTDLVRDLTIPLPVIVISELLGVDPERRGDFKRWSDAFIAGVGRRVAFEETIETMREFNEYFEEQIDRRRSEPGDDLLSVLVHAETSEGRLSPRELLAFTRLLLVAGNETTTNLIGNAVIALLENPGELDRLRSDLSLIPDTVEETLRWDPPVQALPRVATEDVELRGEKIAKGERVTVLFGAANRDPAKFPDPDSFDITRDTKGHVGFGFGIHFCLGSHLARLEARYALEAVITRMPDLRLAGPIERHTMPLLRGPASLPLEFTPA